MSKVWVDVARSAVGFAGPMVSPGRSCSGGDVGDCLGCVSSCRFVRDGNTFNAHESPVRGLMRLVVVLSCCRKEVLAALVVATSEGLFRENAAVILGYGVLLGCCVASSATVWILIIFFFFFFLVG